jgi:peptide/nickel transport system permease protein
MRLGRIARRLALVPPTLLGITLVSFLLLELAPGDPAEVRVGQAHGASPTSIAALRHAYGIDRPLPVRFASWAVRAVALDFGRSFVDGRPVRDRLLEALPQTLLLALLAAAMAYLLAVPIGCALAAGEGRRWASLVSAALFALYAVPVAALALFAVALGAPYGEGPLPIFAAAACLSLAALVRLSRYQRGALLAVLRAEYLVTARAVGTSPARALVRHALPNALLPMLTLLSIELPVLLSGSVVVEQVFGVRGLGLLGFDAVLERDYPTVLGLVTFSALLTLGGVLLADVGYGLLDPRLKERA